MEAEDWRRMVGGGGLNAESWTWQVRMRRVDGPRIWKRRVGDGMERAGD